MLIYVLMSSCVCTRSIIQSYFIDIYLKGARKASGLGEGQHVEFRAAKYLYQLLYVV